MEELKEILKKRFEEHMNRHADFKWEDIEAKLTDKVLAVLLKMEETEGEPDVVADTDGSPVYADCSAESPKGRRSLCYDEAALAARKKNPPVGSVEAQCREFGTELMNEELYRSIQKVSPMDLKTSSWIATPNGIRALGGALFCERRYDTVFVFHNGADSYYGVRGWRAVVRL